MCQFNKRAMHSAHGLEEQHLNKDVKSVHSTYHQDASTPAVTQQIVMDK